MDLKNDIYLGDCLQKLQKIDNNSVDLIVTSLPYADQRKQTAAVFPLTNMSIGFWYSISKELLRVLKPTGTFILNIKEKVQNGERSTLRVEHLR